MQSHRPHLRLVRGTGAPQAREAIGSDWSLLMGRAQAGDGVAYKQLLDAMTPYLRALAARRLPAQVDVEDVVQDILLTLHSIRATYDPALPLGPWLKAIATLRVIVRLRYHYRRQAREREVVVDTDFTADDNVKTPSADNACFHHLLRRPHT